MVDLRVQRTLQQWSVCLGCQLPIAFPEKSIVTWLDINTPLLLTTPGEEKRLLLKKRNSEFV